MRKPYKSDRLRSEIDQNFTPVPNELFASELSVTAKLVWAYMFSKPSTWDFSSKRIGEALGLSAVTVKKVLNELIEGEWLIRYENGRRSRYVFLVPVECNSEYPEDSPIAHTYGDTRLASEEVSTPSAPELSVSEAIERVLLAYSAHDLPVEYPEKLAHEVWGCKNWQEFDGIVATQVASDYPPIDKF